MQRSIKYPTVRMYKDREGVKEFVMAPVLEPTPDKPYVCEVKIKCFGKPKKATDSSWGTAKPSSPWSAEFGRDNSNGDEEIQLFYRIGCGACVFGTI